MIPFMSIGRAAMVRALDRLESERKAKAILDRLEAERKAAIIRRHSRAAVNVVGEVLFAVGFACFLLLLFRLALQAAGVM